MHTLIPTNPFDSRQISQLHLLYDFIRKDFSAVNIFRVIVVVRALALRVAAHIGHARECIATATFWL